jgi:hypothetical protein
LAYRHPAVVTATGPILLAAPRGFAVQYTSFVHSESPFCGPRLGVFLAPPGLSFSNTLILVH